MEKVWLKSYAEGVPAEVPTPEFKSLREMIEFSFSEYADRPAFTNFGTTLSYRDIDTLSMRFACYLQKSLGLTRGERVAIMLPNVLQYPVVLAGLFRAGLVAVNVNPLYTPRELKHQLSDSGAKCIVILENFADTLEEVLADVNVEHIITARIGDLLGWPKSAITNFVVKHVKKAVPLFSLPGRVRLPSALRAGARNTLDHVELGFADIAFLQYTGGTTGVSKGAMLSHRNMVCNVHQARAWQLDVYDMGPVIPWYVDLRGTASPPGFLDDAIQYFGHACRVPDFLLITNHVLEQGHLFDLLKTALANGLVCRLRRDQQHWCMVPVGTFYRGNEIGDSRAILRNGHAHFPAGPGVAIGTHAGVAFVRTIPELNARRWKQVRNRHHR